MPKPVDALMKQVDDLQEELYCARATVLDLMPPDIQKLLCTYRCKSRSDLWQWHHETAVALVELADARPAREMKDYLASGERAVCPLCGQGSMNPFGVRGFAIPNGLLMHLKGDGNARECTVMRVARLLGRDRIRRA